MAAPSDHRADPRAEKPEGYYGARREDLVAMLPAPLGRVLDIGCGEGNVARALRDAGASEIAGVEIMPDAAAVAEAAVDHLFVGPVEEALAGDELPGPFDTIVAYDVLEHLVDPESVLRELRGLAAPGGRLHVSVPNARNFTLMRDLVLRGTFGYTDFGHRDATHLRWFTRRDIIEAIERSGWSVTSWGPNTFRGRDRPVDRVTRGRLREFIALQWNVLAVAA
jgi:2-polyprenyl-3-methyl-5-hydroxy-6-metoxy-1,4-benzoquinol methylase